MTYVQFVKKEKGIRLQAILAIIHFVIIAYLVGVALIIYARFAKRE